jgi:molecular chaperone HtpG
MTVEAHKETIGFKTEISQLMDLIIHSLYSNKEIFLRELISNASDAADKLRFIALADDGLYEGDVNLKIWVDVDKERKTITVRDNGIGMTREEVMENIGTIAKSGTKDFFSKLTGDEAKDSQLIGQFGVGFYSAFIVADKVMLTTRKAGESADKGVIWESKATGDYTIENYHREARGTTITLHLRESEEDLLENYRIRSIIKKYSDHIVLPIVMQKTSTDDKDETTIEEETVNSTTALWTRNKADISDEEYHEFYKTISHDFENPLMQIHNRVEGTNEYISLLYIPSKAPYDLWDRNNRHGLKLYVKRVFIMDDAEQLLPPYLRFVRGIIDSNNLPLNVSREILQSNRQIDTIRNGTVKKILGALAKLAETEAEKYATFWKHFGRVMKEGILDDYSNKEKIAKLLRFSSTYDDKTTPAVSLDDYVSRMQQGQDKIYYLTSDDFNAACHSPHLEIFRKKGIEVILLHEQIDEFMISHLHEFDGKPLQSVTKGVLDLGKLDSEEDKKAAEKISTDLKPFIERVKTALADKVKDVRVSQRLTRSPACLVADSGAMDANLERMLQAAGQVVSASKPIMELNPDHALIHKIQAETDEIKFNNWADILFDQSLISEGAKVADPAGFIAKMNDMILSH